MAELQKANEIISFLSVFDSIFPRQIWWFNASPNSIDLFPLDFLRFSNGHLGGGFKNILCSPLPGEMIQFD